MMSIKVKLKNEEQANNLLELFNSKASDWGLEFEAYTDTQCNFYIDNLDVTSWTTKECIDFLNIAMIKVNNYENN